MQTVPQDDEPDAAPLTARELVRKRSRSYARPETGRHHHIGAAPQRQPQLDEQGAGYVETSAVQLAQRTVGQLERQRGRYADAMARAARELDFEQAARLRDAVTAVDAELERRRC